ncbi:MAG: oligoendopeptidase F [Clostridia bacterium]|nr:oligoendopeptidase F [Clostridia bacterium]
MEQELTRETVDPRYTWDLTRIFETDEAWEKELAAVRGLGESFAGRAGTLSAGRQTVLEALKAYMDLSERITNVHTYAMMKSNEDGSRAQYQDMYSRAATAYNEIMAKCAFFVPELLALSQQEMEAMIADPAFAEFDVFLGDVLREKPYTLSVREERLLAQASEVCGVPESAADMLAIDLDLGMTRGEDGKKTKLTDARFLPLLVSTDRAVRKSAYVAMMNGHKKMGNTIAALYAGQVKADLFESAARGYRSPRHARLYHDAVDESVYDSLIDAVHGGIGTLDAYLRIKKERLGLSVLHLYDLYAGEDDGFETKMDIDEAFATFLEAVAPLGEDYVRDASRALGECWIDVYETKNKRSGAYSCGSVHRTTPYVLLNHKKTYDGLSTLCHEMGHAMHSFYSNGAQPYAKAHYTIFVAEVASTCNEILLSEYLRKKHADDPKAQAALIGSLLQHFRTTVFRQTMFAEFEHKAHVMAQEGKSLTQESLSQMYYELNKLYYGGSCKVDREVESEWMRIPHFYSPYYVYKYATGFCAAVALARGILSGDPEKVAAYRTFLTLGGSMKPIEELKVAGVDMSAPQPVCEALDYFAELVMAYGQLGKA